MRPDSSSPLAHTLARELATTVVFSTAVAAAFTGLGYAGTAIARFGYDRTWLLLSERQTLAIFVPVFVCAWAWCALRRAMLRRASTTILATGALGLAAALANRFVLFADAEASFCDGRCLMVKASDVFATAAHAVVAGEWAPVFAYWRDELASAGSLLWFSVYGVALAVIAALAVRSRVRVLARTA
jgi:hypothetical protein